ncbi:alpha-1,3-mannosyltransferase CMT1 [Xylariomycetidae sp. FL0641]|nr:alpha-1,3-mannosyltransferase CMT1 [Xylariomycetidae sp. FL0641]
MLLRPPRFLAIQVICFAALCVVLLSGFWRYSNPHSTNTYSPAPPRTSKKPSPVINGNAFPEDPDPLDDDDAFQKYETALPVTEATKTLAPTSTVISPAELESTESSQSTESTSTSRPSAVSEAEFYNQFAFPKTHDYVQAVMKPESAKEVHMHCPVLESGRYGHLQAPSVAVDPDRVELKYFFALDLTQCVDLLPRLLGSIIQTIRFLGPSSCALSIVEGASQDGTRDVLEALQPELDHLGIRYILTLDENNSREGDRIGILAQLRNMALAPILDPESIPPDAWYMDDPMPPATQDTTVVFLNDVALCPSDILELLHQRVFQSADMTCAMDWTSSEHRDPSFYDAWVARSIQGDTFFEIYESGDWSHSWDLFWNDRATRERYVKHLPFQVFACWNGGVTFSAGPLLGLTGPGYVNDGVLTGRDREEDGAEERRPEEIRPIAFRSSVPDECFMGEPTLFCKDLWYYGYNRIAVIPTVNLEYSEEASKLVRQRKGDVSQLVAQENVEDTKINWQDQPPEKVKCMPNWQWQSWIAWNDSLPLE